MMLSEAIDAAASMVGRYANGGANAGDSYIGALAAMLASYPRQVALRCADKVRGLTRECKFLPTQADVVAWCERETEPLYDRAERERRVTQQLADRAAFESEQTAERSQRLSVAELKAKYGDWTKYGKPDKPSPFNVRQIDVDEITVSPFLIAAMKQRGML